MQRPRDNDPNLHTTAFRLVPDARGGRRADESAIAALEDLAVARGVHEVVGFAPLVGGARVPWGVAFSVDATGELAVDALAPEPGLGTRLALVRGVKARLVRKRRGEFARGLGEAATAGASAGPVWTVPMLDRIAREGGAGARGRARGNPDPPRWEERPLRSAEPKVVSADARIAGAPSLGSIGFGRREATLWTIQPVDANAAEELRGAELALLVRAGSVGYGRQVSLDLAADPTPHLGDAAGRAALGALAAAQNVAQANREVLEARIRAWLVARLGPKLLVQPWIDQVEVGLDELAGLLRHRRGVLAPIPRGQFVLRGREPRDPAWLCRAHAGKLAATTWDGAERPAGAWVQPLARLELLAGFQGDAGSRQRD